jgi:hypothetical protein
MIEYRASLLPQVEEQDEEIRNQGASLLNFLTPILSLRAREFSGTAVSLPH